ncbi:MAG: hypothetical protein II884_05225 [Synergistaceae bacterium]|nr:hypothetical protein [Synergistaceae bacterium]
MYELQEYLHAYYDEIDPKKRLEILDSLHEDENTNYLHALYINRYSDHENKGRKNVDWWLWRCICLHQLYNRGRLFRRFRDREVNAIITELCMNDESHSAMLYYEYRNVCRRYLSTCKSSDYASSFMGFRKAGDDEKVIRACEDIWQMSKGVAISAGVEDKMHLWIEAFHDELMNYDSICHDEYERLDSRRK